MVNKETRSSPITGDESRWLQSGETDLHWFEEEIGRWGTTDAALENGLQVGKSYKSEEVSLSPAETKRLLAHISSRIWEACRSNQKRPVISPRRELPSIPTIPSFRQVNQVWLIEDLWQECKTLSFETKAARTLRNLVMLEEEVGEGIKLCISLDSYPGVQSEGKANGAVSFKGLIYSSTERERLLVLQHLKNEGLIIAISNPLGSTTDFFVTPKGYSLVESIQAGESEFERKVFMICRFTPEMDDIFNRCYKDAGNASFLNCTVQRVKDIHHVDKVDDKIIRMIEESTIVIVDLSDHNFNVAFEAGYAMALGKPIVWTKMRTSQEEELDLPFDIQSHNILVYFNDNLDAFLEALQERMKAAFEKALSKPRRLSS